MVMGDTAAYLEFLEATTSAHVTKQEALRLLNFTLFFQEKAFANDTPLGDSALVSLDLKGELQCLSG
jgi:hypothetical protein